MESLVLHDAARALGIVNPVAAIIDGVEVGRDPSPLDATIERLLGDLQHRFEQVQRSPEYLGFATLFEKLGHGSQTPAGQRLVKGFLKNGFKRINNVVDAYNVVSARHACGLGLHDARVAASLGEQIDVFRAGAADVIVPLFKTAAVAVPAGDLAYGRAASPRTLYAALGKRDVDSDDLKVGAGTTSLLLVVLGNANTSRAFNEGICDEVLELLQTTCADARMRRLQVLDQH